MYHTIYSTNNSGNGVGRHEKEFKMSTNQIFKLENVHVITRRKWPIFIVQHEPFNIMWPYLKNQDVFTERGPAYTISNCKQKVELAQSVYLST